MNRLSQTLVLCAFVLGLSTAAQAAGYLENPDYPLSATEQLYADLAKLPPAERHKRLVEGAKKEGVVEFIQTLGGALGRNNTKVFKQKYPFVEVRETNMSTDDAMNRVVAEERAEKHITDVTGGDLTESTYPLELGFFARYPTPATDKVLPQYKGFLDPHNRYVVYSWLEKGMSYNNRLISAADAPKQWMDLCDPKFRGQFSVEPARTRVLLFLEKMMGREKMVEWLECVAANDPIVMKGATVRLELMLAGDHPIQGVNSIYKGMYYISKKGAKKVPFSPVFSAPIMGQPSGCAVNRMSPRPYVSALLCDNLLSDEVQQFMYDNYRNPVTMPSPFLPTDVQLITVGPAPIDKVEELHGLWKKYIGQRKG